MNSSRLVEGGQRLSNNSAKKTTVSQMRRAWAGVLLLLSLICPSSFAAAAAPGPGAMEFFKHFDRDGNGFLEARELDALRKALVQAAQQVAEKEGGQSQSVKADAGRALAEMDADGDGRLAYREFEDGWKADLARTKARGGGAAPQPSLDREKEAAAQAAMEELFPDEEVEYKAADGTVRREKRDALLKKIIDQEELMRSLGVGAAGAAGGNMPGGGGAATAGRGGVGGALPKGESGELKIEEVEEKNPALFRFITLGRYALATLRAHGYAAPGAELSGLTTKADGDAAQGEAAKGERTPPLVREGMPKDRDGPLVLLLTATKGEGKGKGKGKGEEAGKGANKSEGKSKGMSAAMQRCSESD